MDIQTSAYYSGRILSGKNYAGKNIQDARARITTMRIKEMSLQDVIDWHKRWTNIALSLDSRIVAGESGKKIRDVKQHVLNHLDWIMYEIFSDKLVEKYKPIIKHNK